MLTPEEKASIKRRLEAIAININTPHDIVLNQDDIDVFKHQPPILEEQNGIL